MKKRGFIFLVIFTLIAQLFLPVSQFAFAESSEGLVNYKDIKNHWGEEEILKAIANELVEGYPDETFRPDKSITRAEFITILNRLDKEADSGKNETFVFKDVNQNHWFYQEVQRGVNKGYLSGYTDGSFKPNQPITRQEAAVIVSRVLDEENNQQGNAKVFKDQVHIDAWAKGEIQEVVNLGIMNGYPDETFQPKKKITRAEAVVTFNRLAPFLDQVEQGISGKVTINGQVTEGATVKLYESGSHELLKEAKTRKNGTYGVHLEEGKYDVTVEKGEFLGFETNVVVDEDENIQKDIKLEKGVKVTGNVINHQNTTVEAVAFLEESTLTSDVDGEDEFEIYVLPNREYKVIAILTNGKTESLGSHKIAEDGEDLGDLVIYYSSGGSSGGSSSDRTKPKIVITNPTEDETYATKNSVMTISGTASDNRSVSKVEYELSVGEDVVSQGVADGTTNWEITQLSLQPGKNVIKVTAIDSSDNKKTATLTVHVQQTIAGFAKDDAGNPLVNQVLTFTSETSEEHTVTTNEKGYFTTKIKQNDLYQVTGEGLSVELKGTGLHVVEVTNQLGEISLGKTFTSGGNEASTQPGTILMEQLVNVDGIEVASDETKVTFNEAVELYQGDIILLPEMEGHLGGLALKVISVTSQDGQTIVETIKPELDEVYASIKGSYSDLQLSPEYFTPAEGVEIITAEPRTFGSLSIASTDDQFQTAALEEITTLQITFGPDKPVQFSGSLALQGDVDGDIDWAWEWDLVDSYDFSIEGKQVLKGELLARSATDWSKRLGEFHIPTSIPGITVDVPVEIVFNAEGNVSLSFEAEATEKIGIKYDDDNGIRIYPDDKFQAHASVNVNTAAKVEVGLSLTEAIAAAGINLAGVEEEAGIFGELGSGIPITCAEFKYGMYLRANVTVPIADWEPEGGFSQNFEFEPFKMGECDVITGLRVEPTEMEIAPGQYKTLAIHVEKGGSWDYAAEEDFEKLTFESSNPNIVHIGEGEFKAAEDVVEGTEATITVSVGGIEKTINVTVAEEEGTGTLIGQVTDAVTEDPITSATVKVYKDNSLIKERTTKADGSYEIELVPGRYRVVVSYTDYIPATTNITITEADTTTYDAKLLLVGEEYAGNGIVGGTITDAVTGQPLPNITIDIRSGRNVTEGDIIESITTDENGQYDLVLPGGNYTASLSAEGYVDTHFNLVSIGSVTRDNQNATISPEGLLGDSIRIVLNWGATPSDLDSHFTGPTDSGNSRFHVYYADKYYQDSRNEAELDVDDTTSYGPETITVVNRLDEGTYTYAIHNYSSRNVLDDSLANSNATVRVYSGATKLAEYNVPLNKNGNVWRVFEIRDGSIVTINQIDQINGWMDPSYFAPINQLNTFTPSLRRMAPNVEKKSSEKDESSGEEKANIKEVEENQTPSDSDQIQPDETELQEAADETGETEIPVDQAA